MSKKGQGFKNPYTPMPFDQKIKPNYQRIRSIYLLICLVASFVVLLMEFIMYFVFKASPEIYGEFKTSIFIYFLQYLIFPSALNFLSVGIAWLVHKRCKNELVQNCAPIVSMVVICTVSACAHSIYPVTMTLFFLPIFMVSIYGLHVINFFTSGLSVIGLALAIVCRYFSLYRPKPDNNLIPESLTALIILIAASSIAFVLTLLLNTQKSRLINATKEAQISRQQAQAANQAKSEFLANMSHEIRTPLNTVIGLTEMISRTTNETSTCEYAGDIQQASTALLSIINDILDISKIESGKMEINETNYELGSLINDSYNMVASRWIEKGLTAKVTCDPMLPCLLCGDEYHIRQIIVNLLSNAVKYTQKGGIEFKVSGEENGDILRMDISVIDTGIGIKQEDLPNLFQKFIRLDITRNRKVEGTGLGLSIAKRLVDLMHGTIEVESEYGKGSNFTVRIPQKIVDRTPIGDIHATYLDMHGEIEKYHQSFEAPNARILVVDDVNINLMVISKLLEATKIQVDTASSGKECLKKVCENQYDLILMDHMMPEMDGVETLHEMKKLDGCFNKDVPVIMLTANAMLGARENYLKNGFSDYLSKPVRGNRLEQMILKHLSKDKVSKIDVPDAKTSSSVSLKDLKNLIPEMDIGSGITYCAGDETFYRTMLQEFIASKRDEKLQDLYEKENWRDYQIEIHSLKSSSRMVGLPLLSEECAILESAIKNGDLDYVKDHHEPVLNHYRVVVNTLIRIEF